MVLRIGTVRCTNKRSEEQIVSRMKRKMDGPSIMDGSQLNGHKGDG